ncbi:MAG: hypothetical protein ACPG4Y_10525 [Chitinophagales bacterium]
MDVETFDLNKFEVNNSFYEEMDLLITIKSFDLQSIRNRYIKSVKTTANNTVGSVEKRDSHLGGLALLKIRNGAIISENIITKTKEPRGVDIDGNRWAFSSENVIFVIEDDIKYKVENDWFSYIHTVKFSPFNANCILISSSGLDMIFEINFKTNQVIREWCAWENGFSLSYYKEDGTDLFLTRNENIAEKYKAENKKYLLIKDAKTDFLPTAKRAAFINSIAYHPRDKNKCLATFFHEGSVREIDFETGESTILHQGMQSPHGGMFVGETLIVTNTRGGEVIKKSKEKTKVFSFKNLEGKPDYLSEKEWIQNSILTKDKVIAIDSNRNQFVIIDENKKQVSKVDYNLSWAVQDIMILENETVLKSIENYA